MEDNGKRIRVNGEYLMKHNGEMVTIVGQIIDKESDPMTIRSTDSKTISVHKDSLLKPDRFSQQWVEITGTVGKDGTITEKYSVPINSDISTEAWNQLVKITDKYDGKVF